MTTPTPTPFGVSYNAPPFPGMAGMSLANPNVPSPSNALSLPFPVSNGAPRDAARPNVTGLPFGTSSLYTPNVTPGRRNQETIAHAYFMITPADRQTHDENKTGHEFEWASAHATTREGDLMFIRKTDICVTPHHYKPDYKEKIYTDVKPTEFPNRPHVDKYQKLSVYGNEAVCMLNLQSLNLWLSQNSYVNGEPRYKNAQQLLTEWNLAGVLRNEATPENQYTRGKRSSGRIINLAVAGVAHTFSVWGRDATHGVPLFLIVKQIKGPKRERENDPAKSYHWEVQPWAPSYKKDRINVWKSTR